MKQVYIKIRVLILFLIFLLYAQGCKSPNGPDNSSSGRRDYTWTADTIKVLDNALTLTRIWGITPSNVWAVGTSSATFLSIWHYNGYSWDCDSVGRNNNPWAIIGYSNDEVWMGNTNSTIWKFNGLQWQLYGKYAIEGFDEIWIMDFDGTSSSNIYGVGGANKADGSDYKGLIMQYDGTAWKILNIPSVKVGFANCKIDNYSGALIIAGTDYEPTGWIEKVYAWDGVELKELYSGSAQASVGRIQNRAYVYIDKKIYKYENNKLVLWKDMSATDCLSMIWCGRSESDFFMLSSTGIGHYNGTDFKTIYNIYGDTYITGGFIFEKDVFFLLHNYQTGVNICLHGILK